jgi:hypothetical protein
MKKNIGLLGKTIKKEVFTMLSILLLNISCTKEHTDAFPPPPPPPPQRASIFTTQILPHQTNNDSTGGIELGVKFKSAVDGKIDGIKFYKTAGNTGTHTAQLYTRSGALLASGVFVNETDSGWQSLLFATAIPITADTTYIAAYHSSLGNYSATDSGLKSTITNGPLTALADSTDGHNGVYIYTSTPAFPTQYSTNKNMPNYWVDVIESYWITSW